jgi:putative cofactor-binding repeat protein
MRRILPFLLLPLLLLPSTAAAQTFAVNTAEDVDLPAGCGAEPTCSLRDALAAAIASPDPANTVSIPKGHYTLALGTLTAFDEGLSIRGAGARDTIIDGASASRVVNFTGGSVSLEALTITGGSAASPIESFPGDGGGILVQSSAPSKLTLNQVNLSGNSATLNGGGLAAPPESAMVTEVIVNDSTIAGNRVTGGVAEGMGGGIYSFGDLTISNSTISGNTVENPGLNAGGGILTALDPADTDGSTVAITNSTIAGNSVLAGGSGGGISVDNPTAGIATAFDVRNTIVAGNSAGGTPADCAGVLTLVSANNISGDASCMFTDSGSKASTDPQLGPLQDNGGGTDTQKPIAASPAVEGGTNQGCPPADQRGVSRPLGPSCDIGAVEQKREADSPAADLALQLKAKPKRPKAGHKASFILTLSNKGPAAATGVKVVGSVPKATRKAKAKKGTAKLPCKLAKPKKKQKARKLTCNVGSLAAGATRKLTLVIKKAPAKRKLRAKAQVSATTPDPTPANGRSKAVAKVKP